MFLNSQKNQLYTIIEQSGLSHHNFKLEDKGELLITHKPTEFYFKIESKSIGVSSSTNKDVFNIFISYTPHIVNGVVMPNQAQTYNPQSKWDIAPAVFTNWINIIKKETGEPDMWAELERNMSLFDAAADADDVNFTNAEVRTVQARIREASNRLTGADLPSEAINRLISVLEHQSSQSESLTKKEWKASFVSAITGAVISLALNPVQTHDVFKIIKSVFSGLFLN